MKVIPFFIIFVETIRDMDNENLMGFERKLREILGNSGEVGEIIGLIPDNVFLPLYFKGDVVRLRDGNKITITDVGYRRGEYNYYFEDENGETWYEREENMIYGKE
jgi:hypothetical protein